MFETSAIFFQKKLTVELMLQCKLFETLRTKGYVKWIWEVNEVLFVHFFNNRTHISAVKKIFPHASVINDYNFIEG